MPAFTRRAFLAGTAAAFATSALPAFARPGALYLGARFEGESRFFASAFDAGGGKVLDVPLPARGHGITLDPHRARAVFFARRPGDFAKVVDLVSREPVATITARAGRFFCGHGVFSSDGALLYATETIVESGEGIVGVYDARNGYARLGEMPSGGLDPHDIRLVRGGRLLVVANGGLLTHPDAPGVKLNLDSMDSSLVILDPGKRAPVAAFRLPPSLRQLSLRHLAVNADDVVAVVMQYEGPRADAVPLVALHRGDGPLTCLDLPETDRLALRQYCGSAAFDSSGRVLGVTSPRGGTALFVDVAGGRVIGRASGPDICGIAMGEDAGAFVVTSGLGGAWWRDARANREESFANGFAAGAHWDNHLAAG